MTYSFDPGTTADQRDHMVPVKKAATLTVCGEAAPYQRNAVLAA